MKRLLWSLVVLGFVAAVASGVRRADVEARNRRVEVALDYTELRDLAAAEGRPLADVLRPFRAAGATSVVVQEDTLGGLEEARRLQVRVSKRGQTMLLPNPDDSSLVRVQEALRNKTRYKIVAPRGSPSPPLLVDQPYAVVRSVGVGLDPAAVSEIQAAGLGVVGRVSNWEGVASNGVGWTLEQLKQQNVSTVIFSGDEVLGFKGYVSWGPYITSDGTTTEMELREQDLFFGMVEFGKQKGDALLARAAQDRTVRVHTVTGAEMQSANIPGNVQRFLLAARERNIRVLFVRVFAQEPNAIQANLEYVRKIAQGLERANLQSGPAHGYDALGTPLVLRLGMGLGLGAAWCLLLQAVTGLFNVGTARWLRVAAALGASLLVLLAVAPGSTGPKLAAFAAACVFPSLALVHTDLLRPPQPQRLPSRWVLGHVLGRLLVTSGITLLGAATVVGLLADRVFLIKADAFVGIKAAQLIPLVVAALVYGLGLRATPERPWPRVMDDAKRNVGRWGQQPILLWQVALATVGLVALALLVLRSGNEGGVGVSDVELRVRGLLDLFLVARPRFKEFLIGHPALVVALGLAASGRSRCVPARTWWALPVFLVGAVGQVSLLNTFCHLHTPLPVSLLRAGLGLAIGAVLGGAAYLFLDRLEREAHPRRAEQTARAG